MNLINYLRSLIDRIFTKQHRILARLLTSGDLDENMEFKLHFQITDLPNRASG